MDILNEIKAWLRVDEDCDEIENDKIMSLILASDGIIKQSTGLVKEDISDINIEEIFELTRKILITNLYDNPAGLTEDNPTLTSLYIQLEAYKNKLVLEGDNYGN